MPRKVGLGLIGAGLVLVAASALALVSSPDETVGSPDLVEQQLRDASPEEAPSTGGGTAGPSTTVDVAVPPVATVPPGDVARSAGETESEGEPAPDPPAVEPAAEPVGLRIGAIGVEAPVDPFGVDQDTRQMAVPENVTDVAWYKFGPSPGEPGSAVLAAHVDLYGQGPGVFFELRKVEVDDVVHVAYADGTEKAFRVIARTEYDKDELPTEAIFAKRGPAVLTLITCGGTFSRSNRTYDSNVVVYAVPADGTEPLSPGSAG